MIAELMVLAVLAIVILCSAMKIVREDERVAIFRLGHFFSIVGPGLIFLIPVVDKGVKVNLSENIPGWQGLSKGELDEKIKTFVSHKP